ncbi:MAG: hypothetical protein EPO36_09515 [Chloroflexota bacterium]|nr:MAG: hypothetical protein EPO36_09515 [Chloroflexota bacterium]
MTLLAVVLGAAACRPQGTPSPSGGSSDAPSGAPSLAPSGASSGEPTAAPVRRSGGFSVGLEYGVPGLAAASALTGAHRAKPALEFGVWGNIEPREGERDWAPLDNLVAEYQAAGFLDLQLIISADSPWAARTPKRDPMPQDRYLDAYADFVGAFVERYDGDGSGDAPGLLAPVHEYGIEREFTGFWPPSAVDYLRLLRTATPAVRAADPEAQVLLVAIMAIDVFDGNPGLEEADERWSIDRPFRHSRSDIEAILSACDDYDIVDVHALGDATELVSTLAWIRVQLLEADCYPRPIWIGDAFPMSPLVAFDVRPFHPATADDRDAVVRWLGAVADPGDVDHATAMAWLEREMAISVARKVAVARLAGADGINIGNLEDWATGIAPADRLLVAGVGTAVYGGIQDRTVTLRSPGGSLPYEGQFFSRLREAGDPRPALRALELLIPAVEGPSSTIRIGWGDPDIWVVRFEFERSTATTWVAWLDDERLHLPGDAEPAAVRVLVETGVPSVLVGTVPVERSGGAVERVEMAAPGGVLEIDVGRVPVVITAP